MFVAVDSAARSQLLLLLQLFDAAQLFGDNVVVLAAAETADIDSEYLNVALYIVVVEQAVDDVALALQNDRCSLFLCKVNAYTAVVPADYRDLLFC